MSFFSFLTSFVMRAILVLSIAVVVCLAGKHYNTQGQLGQNCYSLQASDFPFHYDPVATPTSCLELSADILWLAPDLNTPAIFVDNGNVVDFFFRDNKLSTGPGSRGITVSGEGSAIRFRDWARMNCIAQNSLVQSRAIQSQFGAKAALLGGGEFLNYSAAYVTFDGYFEVDSCIAKGTLLEGEHAQELLASLFFTSHATVLRNATAIMDTQTSTGVVGKSWGFYSDFYGKTGTHKWTNITAQASQPVDFHAFDTALLKDAIISAILTRNRATGLVVGANKNAPKGGSFTSSGVNIDMTPSEQAGVDGILIQTALSVTMNDLTVLGNAGRGVMPNGDQYATGLFTFAPTRLMGSKDPFFVEVNGAHFISTDANTIAVNILPNGQNLHAYSIDEDVEYTLQFNNGEINGVGAAGLYVSTGVNGTTTFNHMTIDDYSFGVYAANGSRGVVVKNSRISQSCVAVHLGGDTTFDGVTYYGGDHTIKNNDFVAFHTDVVNYSAGSEIKNNNPTAQVAGPCPTPTIQDPTTMSLAKRRSVIAPQMEKEQDKKVVYEPWRSRMVV